MDVPKSNRPHFAIPTELVRSRAVQVRGRSKPFSRPDYSAHGDYLRERAAATRQYANEVADADAAESLFLQVRTPHELPVHGERERLRAAGLEIVALSSVSPNSATVQLRKADLPKLERKLDTYTKSATHRGKSYLQVIDDLAPVPVSEKVSSELNVHDDNPVDCLLLFYTTLSEKERAAVLFAVRSFMARTGGDIGEQYRLSNGVTVVEARLRPSEARRAGAAFSTLRQITPNHLFYIPDSWRISAISTEVRVEPPQLNTAVAVVDTGISPTCTGLSPAILAVLPHLPPTAVESYPEHGTFVASRIVYGDDLESGLRAGVLRPRCPIVDVPVVGLDANRRAVYGHEGHLAYAIDQALPRLPENVRVVNVSLGTNAPVIDGAVSLVAQMLDKHALERRLLVVATAGNIRDRDLIQGFPRSLSHPACRIDSPGEAMLALTVGSIAKHVDRGALSRSQELSAFSRRGPGPFGGVKPDLVAHGGNCLGDGSTSARIGAHGLMPEARAWACDCGTSFAAPLVSAMAASLFDHYLGAHPNLIRALLLHFTQEAVCPDIGLPKEHLVGLGEPNLEQARWAKDHTTAFLHIGELESNRLYFLPFFVPPCLDADGEGRLRIKVTTVVDPPVNPDNVQEYSKARVSLALRKPADVGHVSVSVSQDAIEADRWSPIEQISRTFVRSYSTGTWELQVRLWTRDLPQNHRQSYAVIIEVIDDSATLPVWEEVNRLAGERFTVLSRREAA